MRLRMILAVLVIMVNLIVFNPHALAEAKTPIGIIISSQGQVVALDQASQQRSLQRGTNIYLYDKIITKEDSKAQLRLHDDSVIVVQPSSEFYVSEFTFNKNSPHSNKYVGNIVKGMLINISGQGETQNYKLNSPLTTIAFRGTGIATKLIAKNNILTDQQVYVFQGYVSVSNKCENVVGNCSPRSINVGVGQGVNSVMVNMSGKIDGYKSAGLLEDGAKVVPTMAVKQEGGGVSITCKGK